MYKKNTMFILGAVVVVGIVVLLIMPSNNVNVSTDREISGDSEAVEDTPTKTVTRSGMFDEIQVTNGVKHLVPLDKLLSGGPPKDGIPSIDKPKFISTTRADKFLTNDEIGLGLNIDGSQRFYPFQILVWHEIVNDKINDQAIAVTYCPLCGTGIAYERILDNEEVEFGVSGKLYNSNLVMYDRKTSSYWDQVSGTAIVGELTGSRLTPVPIDTITYGDWKSTFPNTEVLSRDTGFTRSYGVSPYGDYDKNSAIFFPVENTDNRLHPKALVISIEINNQFKAYPKEEVAKVKVVNDNFAGKSLLIIEDQNTKAIKIFDRTLDNEELTFKFEDNKLIDNNGDEWDYDGKSISGKTLTQITHTSGFWFAWFAFHPETGLYQAS